MSRFAFRALLLAACLTAASAGLRTSTLHAQAESGAAALAGTIVDPNGAVVPGAPVLLRSVDTGYRRASTSDAAGRFTLSGLPVGTYEVEVQVTSFAPTTERVQLRVGETAGLTIRLAMSGVSESVSVSGAAPVLDVTGQSSSTNIPLEAIDDLPIRGRSFPEFAQLTPAIVQESDRSGMIISGQRSINSNVSIDGSDFNDPLQGNQRGGNEAVFFFPQSAVNEFQVVRSGLGAEVGRTSAGFVNVVTKSGTNVTRGDLFYFNRNRKMTSADAFDQKLNNQQNQFGGSIGGALVPNRVFAFGAAEQNFLRVPFVVKFQNQASTVVPDSLKALQGEKRGTNNPTAVFGRLDANLASNQTVNVQSTFSRLRGENFNFDSPQQDVAESANYTRKNRSVGVKAGWQSVIGSSMVHEIRGQVATDNRDEAPNQSVPQIVITGFGTLGGDTGRPRVFNNTRYQVSNSLTIARGIHQFRAGTDFNVTPSEQQRESNTLGRFDYTSLANYLAGTISRYRQTVAGFDPADLIYKGTQKEASVYVQDRLTLRQVTLTLGLRWDGQWNPQPTRPNPAISYTKQIPNDLAMWQPRAGLAWNLGGTDRTVVRLSAGMYDARTPANLFQRVFTDNGFTAVSVDSRTDASILAMVRSGQALTLLPGTVTVPAQRVFGFDPDFRNPRTFQGSAAIERRLSAGTTVSASYIHAATSNLQRRLDRNLFPPTYDATGMPIYPRTRPDIRFAQIEVNESTARSRYNALVLTSSTHAGRLFTQVNYTLAYNKDDDSNERNFSREVTLDVFNPGAEYTWSKQDVRHNANISSVLDLPGGWTVGGILIGRSGVPYTAVIGADQQGDGNDDNDRAVINGRVSARNAFRQPNFFNLDLRLMKTLRVGHARFDVMAELFNATRASNKNYGNDGISVYGTAASPVATAGQALFAPSTARFGGPRQLQLGARVAF